MKNDALNTIEQVIGYIYSIPTTPSEVGLERIKDLMERLGNPQDTLSFVHVAGTNGKGSTCTMLSYILTGAGYKTGAFISPYVVNFRERMQINNQLISEKDLMCATNHVKIIADQMRQEDNPPSWFEMIVAIAFVYFSSQKCDIVLLETGIGGRIDATNIIKPPLVSVITSISIDHTDMLGTTIEEIAWEKAAIIKANSHTVCYPRQNPEALAVVMERCAEVGNILTLPHNAEIIDSDIFGSNIIYDGKPYHIELGGEHQVWNSLMVIETCNLLNKMDYSLSYEQIRDGIRNTVFASRLEVLGKEPLVIMDGAHNIGGAKVLSNTLRELNNPEIYAVMGILVRKDYSAIIDELAPNFKSVVATHVKEDEGFLPPEELANHIARLDMQVEVEEDPMKAFTLQYNRCPSNGVVVICGSLHLSGKLHNPIIDYIKEQKDE